MDKVEEPITDYNQLDLSKSYTWVEYMKWKFTERVELIRGHIVKMSPAPNVNHQAIVTSLCGIIYKFWENSPCKLFVSPFDVRLPIPSSKKDSTVVQPDLCIICDENKLDEKGCDGAPDLMVEILSPGNSKHDLDVKFKLYEESGVKEYWIVQPESRDVLVYTLQNGCYIGLRPFAEGMVVQGLMFPELKLPVDDLFRNVK